MQNIMNEYDNKMMGIYNNVCFFAKEIATRDLVHDGLVRDGHNRDL